MSHDGNFDRLDADRDFCARNGKGAVHAHFPITNWNWWRKKPTDVSPVVWNRTGSGMAATETAYRRSFCRLCVANAAGPCTIVGSQIDAKQLG